MMSMHRGFLACAYEFPILVTEGVVHRVYKGHTACSVNGILTRPDKHTEMHIFAVATPTEQNKLLQTIKTQRYAHPSLYSSPLSESKSNFGNLTATLKEKGCKKKIGEGQIRR